MRSTEPIEVPPYFCTRSAIVIRLENVPPPFRRRARPAAKRQKTKFYSFPSTQA
jgi:hypothetical protein